MTTRSYNSGGGGFGFFLKRTALDGGVEFVLMNLLALVFIGIGGSYGYGSLRLVQNGNTVTGTVVDLDIDHSEGGSLPAPIMEYKVDGDSYRMTGMSGIYSSAPWHIGDKVKLRYDRSDPSVARVDGVVEMWLMPAIFLPLELLFFVGYNAFAAYGLFQRMRQGSLGA